MTARIIKWLKTHHFIHTWEKWTRSAQIQTRFCEVCGRGQQRCY